MATKIGPEFIIPIGEAEISAFGIDPFTGVKEIY